MVTSQFAKTVVKQLDNYAVVSNRINESELYVDSQLQEVREVLYQLILRPMPDGSYCWCNKSVTAPSHATRCLRARALWAKLQMEGKP